MDNVTFALRGITTVGIVAFVIGLVIIVVALVLQGRAKKKQGQTAPKTQLLDLKALLLEDWATTVITGPYPEEPTTGPMVYPKPKRAASH